MLTNEEIDRLVAEHVMGEDLSANTPKRIVKALMEIIKFDTHYEWATIGDTALNAYIIKMPTYHIMFELEQLFGIDASYYWIWANRISQPWSYTLEAVVEKWRETPKRYSSEEGLIWDVNRKMIQAGFDLELHYYNGRYEVEYIKNLHSDNGLFIGNEIELPKLVCLAALEAVGVKIDEQTT